MPTSTPAQIEDCRLVARLAKILRAKGWTVKAALDAAERMIPWVTRSSG